MPTGSETRKSGAVTSLLEVTNTDKSFPQVWDVKQFGKMELDTPSHNSAHADAGYLKWTLLSNPTNRQTAVTHNAMEERLIIRHVGIGTTIKDVGPATRCHANRAIKDTRRGGAHF
jgi:hypothetical protein